MERDSNTEAWEYYLKIYKNKILKTNEKFRVLNNRIVVDCRCEFNKMPIRMGGDCSFNFNDKKYVQFKKIIDTGSSTLTDIEKIETEKLLINCQKMHHDHCNLALMPVVGGLNNVKGNIKYGEKIIKVHQVGKRPLLDCFDRLDSFLCLLDDFYKIKSENITLKEAGCFFNNSVFIYALKTENFSALFDFLNSFNRLEDYIDSFYPWVNDDLLIRIRKSGRVKIVNAQNLLDYMNLAIDYWNSVKVYYEESTI